MVQWSGGRECTQNGDRLKKNKREKAEVSISLWGDDHKMRNTRMTMTMAMAEKLVVKMMTAVVKTMLVMVVVIIVMMYGNNGTVSDSCVDYSGHVV